MQLTGHNSGIHHFCWSNDSLRCGTVSRDGTWRVFDMTIEWRYDGDCRCVGQGAYAQDKDAPPARIALSPDGSTAAVSSGARVALYSLPSGKELVAFNGVARGSAVTALSFDSESRLLMTAGTDNAAHIFHNIPGLQAHKAVIEKELSLATKESEKARLRDRISTLEVQLAPPQ